MSVLDDLSHFASNKAEKFFRHKKPNIFNLVFFSMSIVETYSYFNHKFDSFDKYNYAKLLLPKIISIILTRNIIVMEEYKLLEIEITIYNELIDEFIETAIDISNHPNLIQYNSWSPSENVYCCPFSV